MCSGAIRRRWRTSPGPSAPFWRRRPLSRRASCHEPDPSQTVRHLMAVEALRPARDGRRSPRLHNLLNDATTLADLLVDQCAAGQWLDAYLLAAGLDQILEDALHPDALALHRIANRLKASSRGAAGRAAAAVASDGRGLIWGPHAHLRASAAAAACVAGGC